MPRQCGVFRFGLSRVIAFLRQTSKFDYRGPFLNFMDRGEFNNYNFHLSLQAAAYVFFGKL